MINSPSLYKRDSKNSIREWYVIVEDFGSYAEIHVIHGQYGGKKQLKITRINSGKNIGKTNETTYLQQAKNEAVSKFNKQVDKGYSQAIPKPKEKVFRPMLAQDAKKHSHKIQYPCAVQPKLDGLRSNILFEQEEPVGYSRRGKKWKVIDHILEHIKTFLQVNPSFILDGELFTDKISFQQICSAIKRDETNELTNLVEFHCYDVYDKNDPGLEFHERLKLIPKGYEYLKPVETIFCNSFDEVKEQHQINIANGYEGTIIRNLNSKYKVDGRSYDLLKYKDFMDREYKIVDKKVDKNGESVFICLDEELNKTFDCKPKGTHEERVQYLHDDNIGKYLTVKFFEYTTDGLPRFPIGNNIRID